MVRIMNLLPPRKYQQSVSNKMLKCYSRQWVKLRKIQKPHFTIHFLPFLHLIFFQTFLPLLRPVLQIVFFSLSTDSALSTLFNSWCGFVHEIQWVKKVHHQNGKIAIAFPFSALIFLPPMRTAFLAFYFFWKILNSSLLEFGNVSMTSWIPILFT